MLIASSFTIFFFDWYGHSLLILCSLSIVLFSFTLSPLIHNPYSSLFSLSIGIFCLEWIRDLLKCIDWVARKREGGEGLREREDFMWGKREGGEGLRPKDFSLVFMFCMIWWKSADTNRYKPKQPVQNVGILCTALHTKTINIGWYFKTLEVID